VWKQHFQHLVKSRFFVVFVVIVSGWLIIQVMNWSIGPASPLGLKDGHFAPCSNRQNCVNSQSEDPDHAIDPITFATDPKSAQAVLKKVVLLMRGTKLVEESGNYLRFQVTSSFFRFVDDLEFVIEANVIQVRSASRIGYSDLGVNRKRVEQIRAGFQKMNVHEKAL
jgi:uncharacterized protein (DUF1499 family)